MDMQPREAKRLDTTGGTAEDGTEQHSPDLGSKILLRTRNHSELRGRAIHSMQTMGSTSC